MTGTPVVGSTTSSSESAKPIPCSTPPSTWLEAVSGLTIRPTSWTATIRSTRTSPSAGSTATCAIWQPKVLTTKPSGFGPREPEPSIVALPSFSVTSVTSASIAPSCERIRPSRISRSSAAISKTSLGQLEQRLAHLRRGRAHGGHHRRRRLRAAGDRAVDVRRRCRRRSRARAASGSPSSSAATICAPVSVPVPMSWIPVTTCAWPSASSRTVACDGGPPPPHQICVAQPMPRSRPSACGSRSSSRARPAGELGRAVVAGEQVLARVRQPAHLVDVGVVAAAQLERIDVERERELVDRLLERRRALHHAGRPERVLGAKVRLRGERQRAHVGAAVERASGDQDRARPSRPGPSRRPRRRRSR